MIFFLLATGGFLAGFIDAIAGGGGLITLPILSFVFSLGPHAIGTNKINGFLGALVAWIVYLRKKHFDLNSSFLFALATGIGSFAGGRISPYIPPVFFFWVLLGVCPVILYFVFRKDLWLHLENEVICNQNIFLLLLTGFVCGIYDGAFGPGGGTFMFLGLFFVVKLKLFAALAAAKFVNAISAGSALISYQLDGYVHWKEGLAMGAGMSLGSALGATLATRKASTIVRPLLVVVVILLLIKLGLPFVQE